jgi:hypothetical protein
LAESVPADARREWLKPRASASPVEGFLDGGDDFALDGKRLSRDTRAGSGWMATPAELSGDFIDVYLVTLGSEADTRQFRL